MKVDRDGYATDRQHRFTQKSRCHQETKCSTVCGRTQLRRLPLQVCEEAACSPAYGGARELELTFEGDDFAGGVHDGAVRRDGPADGVVGVGHVDDDHLGLLAHLLPYADELVGLHGQSAESDVGWVDSQVLELRCESMKRFSGLNLFIQRSKMIKLNTVCVLR